MQDSFYATKIVSLIFPGASQNVGYRINARTRECQRFTLREPFRRIEVPDLANFTSSGYIGSSVSGAGVLVNVFSGDTEHGE